MPRDLNLATPWAIYSVTVSLQQTASNGSTKERPQVISLTSRTLEIISQSEFLSRSLFFFFFYAHVLIADLSTYVRRVFVKDLDVMFSHVLDKTAKEHEIIDFHDLMFKFTLDSFVEYVCCICIFHLKVKINETSLFFFNITD